MATPLLASYRDRLLSILPLGDSLLFDIPRRPAHTSVQPGGGYLLWLAFFSAFTLAVMISIYLDSHPIEQKTNLLGRLFAWYLDFSIVYDNEVVFIGALLVLTIAPQLLSLTVSGVFGCARAPSAVVKITKVAAFLLIKLLCGLSAFNAAMDAYFFVDDYLRSHGASSAFGDLLWTNPQNIAYALAIAFAIAALYYDLDKLSQLALKSDSVGAVANVWRNMTYYSDRVADRKKDPPEGAALEARNAH